MKLVPKDKRINYDKVLFSNEIIIIFRKFLTSEERVVRQLTIKNLRHFIEIDPIPVTEVYLKKFIPIIICKIFEDQKSSTFEERLDCFKLIFSWLKFYPDNFPLIVCQGVIALAKGKDEHFKKGCIEFIRLLSIKKPAVF